MNTLFNEDFYNKSDSEESQIKGNDFLLDYLENLEESQSDNENKIEEKQEL